MKRKKKRRNSKERIFYSVIGLVVLCCAIFLAATYLFPKPLTLQQLHKLNLEGKGRDVDYVYRGFSFIYHDDVWYTQAEVGDRLVNVALHFGPKDLEGVIMKGELSEDFFRKPLYVSFNPEVADQKYLTFAIAELKLNLGRAFGIRFTLACDRPNSLCAQLPIIKCGNKTVSVIHLKDDAIPAVRLMEDCIELRGNNQGWDIVAAAERFLYKMYGIMP